MDSKKNLKFLQRARAQKDGHSWLYTHVSETHTQTCHVCTYAICTREYTHCTQTLTHKLLHAYSYTPTLTRLLQATICTREYTHCAQTHTHVYDMHADTRRFFFFAQVNSGHVSLERHSCDMTRKGLCTGLHKPERHASALWLMRAPLRLIRVSIRQHTSVV